MNLPVRIVADENIPGEVVWSLRREGHKVYWVAEEKPGMADADVWDLAASRQALLLTKDQGYLPQLTKDQILHGPRVLVFTANGVRDDELRSSEIFCFLSAWCLRQCKTDDWHYVELTLAGKHNSRTSCWGNERRRRERRL